LGSSTLSDSAPILHILSILAGKDYIEGDLEIIESPWLNLLSLPDLERLLLFAFESATLTEHKRIPEMFLKFRQTLNPNHQNINWTIWKARLRRSARLFNAEWLFGNGTTVGDL
jgi:hypothetical protein